MWARENADNTGTLDFLPERFSTLDDTGELMLTAALLDDSGVFYCIASNEVGSASISVELQILGEYG